MPTKVRENFNQRVESLLRDYGEMLIAVHGKTRQASLEIMLSEQAAMSLGVYWEAFIHDLFVAYVTRNPVSCIRDFKERVDTSLATKFGMPTTWVKINIPTTLSARHAQRMIDPKGWNVNATSAKELRDKANQFLHSADARNFALAADDSAFVDLLVAVRNYLAHRSSSSRAILKAAIRQVSLTGSNADLAGTQPTVGAYLKAATGANYRRVHSIGQRLIEVSQRLSP